LSALGGEPSTAAEGERIDLRAAPTVQDEHRIIRCQSEPRRKCEGMVHEINSATIEDQVVASGDGLADTLNLTQVQQIVTCVQPTKVLQGLFPALHVDPHSA
jgi:hypothetical protein